jgi:hypothetical protein
METVSASMSAKQHKISTKLQELISQANNRIPSTGEAIRAVYNQALEEGFAPREAKYMLYNNVVFLNKKTIRRYLPLEARDTEKIRNKNHIADNDPQVSAEKGLPLSHQVSEGKIIAGTISNEEIANHDLNHKNILSSQMTIMKLENIMKSKDRYIIELLEKNERLGSENQRLKEELQAYTSGVLKVKVEIHRLYRDMLLVRDINPSQGIMSISNGKYRIRSCIICYRTLIKTNIYSWVFLIILTTVLLLFCQICIYFKFWNFFPRL